MHKYRICIPYLLIRKRNIKIDKNIQIVAYIANEIIVLKNNYQNYSYKTLFYLYVC